MSAEVERAKAHYEGLKNAARRAASLALRAAGLHVTIVGWSRRTADAIEGQWGDERRPDASWLWSEIFRRYSDFKNMSFAVWTGDGRGDDDRLVAVGIVLLTRTAATVRIVEGDPRAGCEFKGKRVLMALEVATNYALANGLAELRIQPLNDALAKVYEDVYGFSLVKAKGAEPYWRRVI